MSPSHHAPRPRRQLSRVAGLAVSAYFLAVVFAGCALSRSGSLSQQCTSDAECPDPGPCAQVACSPSGLCSQKALDNTSSLEQTAGDCLRQVCKDGAALAQHDDGDAPTGVRCETAFSCEQGAAVERKLVDGDLCFIASTQGSCRGGECEVQCAKDVDCPDQDCNTHLCDIQAKICEYTVVDSGDAPSAQQTAGDCQKVQCDRGTPSSVTDDSDVPADGNECTVDACTGGVPSNPPRAGLPPCDNGAGFCDATGTCTTCSGKSPGTPCPGDKVCDGNGSCVDCVTDAHCGTCGLCLLNTCAVQPATADPHDDCKAGELCDGAGNCVCGLIPPPPGPGACPAECDNCSGLGNVCNITCATPSGCADRTVNCPAGYACAVQCSGDNSCANVVVNCPADYACRLNCLGDGSCDGGDLNCSQEGVCDLLCSSSFASPACDNFDMSCQRGSCGASCTNTPTSFAQTCDAQTSCACTESLCL